MYVFFLSVACVSISKFLIIFFYLLWFRAAHTMVEAAGEAHADEEIDGEEKPDASRAVYNVTFPAPKEPHASDGTVLKAPGSYTQQQLLHAMLDAVQKTQGPRLTPLRLKLMADFREKHANGFTHDHLAVLAEHPFRFGPLKKVSRHCLVMLSNYLGGASSHMFSCTSGVHMAATETNSVRFCRESGPASNGISFPAAAKHNKNMRVKFDLIVGLSQ